MASPQQALREVRSRRVDREFVRQDELDVASRPRTNALPWRGQFTPGLPSVILEALNPTGVVLDPFVGSGTTLGEAIRLGLPSAGAEVNPAAFSLASVYELAGLDTSRRQEAIGAAGRAIEGSSHRDQDLAGNLIESISRSDDPMVAKLLVAGFMLALGNGTSTSAGRLAKAWQQVRSLVESFPDTPTSAEVATEDARDLGLADGSIGMVLTSPPYINVFNYHQNYRPAMELLGWAVLPAARSEIGSNRKHRGNRFMTVVQYSMDMAQALDEIARVCVAGSPVVFVVGRESRVRGVAFPNGDLISALAEISPYLDFERWQERSFTSRFGERIYEEVLTFRRTEAAGRIEQTVARELGVAVLLEKVRSDDGSAASSVKDELRDAIAKADAIAPSPPLELLRSTVLAATA